LYSGIINHDGATIFQFIFLGCVRMPKDVFDLPCSGSNWALIGDAFGHVSPIGGMGIYYTMNEGYSVAQQF
jgi:hypothetical protein